VEAQTVVITPIRLRRSCEFNESYEN
jgi:hypothetical protein